MRLLVTGGARSGKSVYAESQLADCGQVDYLATSRNDPKDIEWQTRIAAHRARRPKQWCTIETIDLANEISKESNRALLIDCLGVWLSRVMDEADYWNTQDKAALTQQVDRLVTSLSETTRNVILVTNEVGMSLVPADAGSRDYRDELGRLNAKVAGVCDRVVLCVAGQPLEIKG